MPSIFRAASNRTALVSSLRLVELGRGGEGREERENAQLDIVGKPLCLTW